MNLPELLIASPLTGLVAVLVVYLADYYQTLRGARLYRAGADQVIVIAGSYELNTRFTEEVDRLQRFSPRFIGLLLLYCVVLGVVWVVFVPLLDSPQSYIFILGLILLLQGPVQLRHVRNIRLFKRILAGDGVTGRIEYTRRATYQSSIDEFSAFAGLYLALALLTASWLLAGGALGCAVMVLRQYRDSR